MILKWFFDLVSIRCDDPSQQISLPEIFIIQNDKDGIIGASSSTVIDLFNKTVSIDAADIDQDVMIKMILEKVEVEGREEDDSLNYDVNDVDAEEKSDQVAENSWRNSFRDLKNTISRSWDHYRASVAGMEIFHLYFV